MPSFRPGTDPSAHSISRNESVKLVFSVGAHSSTSRTVWTWKHVAACCTHMYVRESQFPAELKIRTILSVWSETWTGLVLVIH